MRLRRKMLLGVMGLLLLVPTGVLYWVATTESGLRFVLERLDKVGPVTITVRDAGGTLTSGLRLGYVRVQHRLADVTVEQAYGRVELLPLLLRRHIEVPEFTAARASIVLLEDPERRPRRRPRFLPAMLRIDGETVRIDTATLTLRSGRELEFSGISGGVTVLQEQIRVRDASLDWQDWHLSSAGRLHAARPMGLDGEASASWSPAGQPRWQFAGQFDGDLGDLPLSARISAPFNAEVRGKAILQRDWELSGQAGVQDFDLVPFGGGNALGLITGELDFTAARSDDAAGATDLTARGALTPPGLAAGAFDVDFRGTYDDKLLSIRDTLIVHPASQARATVRGTVQVEPGGPRLALAGQWTQLRWPLTASEPAFTSPAGSYQLDGTRPWLVQGEGEVIAAGMPAMPASARGRLDGESFLIDEGTLQLLGGSARFTGEARWNPLEIWHVQGHMSRLDPALLREDLPGRLSFDFRAGGTPFGADGSIDFDVTALTGELRGQPASGKGMFARPAGSTDWRFHDVELAAGSTRLQLDGALGEAPDLIFVVDAEDLSVFDPAASGRLSASGRYSVVEDEPLLRVNARGSLFEWNNLRLAGLTADLDINLQQGNGRAQGTVALTGLAAGARTIERANLTLSGNATRQRVLMDVDAPPLRARLAAEGGPVDGLWQGQLTSMTVEQQDRFALSNETPAPLTAGFTQFVLGQVCLRGGQERLCGTAHREQDGTWSAAFTSDALPLSTLTAGLSQDFTYEGTIDLRGELAGRPGALPTGSVQGQLMEARLRHRLGSGREETMALGTGTVSASASANAFAVQVELDAGSAGNIRGRVDGQREREDWRDYPIAGSLSAQTEGLSLLDIYVGEIDKATGRLETRVDIGGTLGTPTLRGVLQLRSAEIDIYQINLALRQLSLDASFDTSAVSFSGQTRIGAGSANFNGQLSWRDGEPFGNLHLEGDRLQVVNVPEADIRASPRLDFKVEGRRIEASGEVLVPYGRIEPADLTTAVRSSSDEILAGEPLPDPSQRWTVVSSIRLALGDDVRVETLGLAAKLGGALQVRSDDTQVSRGQGELTISDGKYAALGRLLDVDRGRLIFNNVPIDDPGIDLRAQKVYPDVTAGVNVRGSLRAPRLTFYSEPSLPQSQIASLILAGGSIESLRDSGAPGAARNDLLAQGGAILAQRVGSQVGVDDVGIETDSLGDQTSLVLGKYLSPRLYISYGISLAEAINTLKLRWTISENWTVKTEAGQERSADIVYTLKK